ncbi:MAG: hypothetical protein ABR962_08880 [Candidatus Bathyarchaeia archaeon]|jgi:hypothetical protein
MDTPTLRILDTISSNLGDSISINQLTVRIREKYGTAHYANIYQKIQELKKEGLLSLDLMGRSSSIKLNFQNYLLIDTLAEMEIEKKKNFLTKRSDQLLFLTEIDKFFNDTCAIRSISSIDPTKNIKLNKTELLFLLRKTPEYHNETLQLYKEMLKMQKKYNLRINSLITDRDDFYDLISSDEINPLREALSEKISFFCPQAFWSDIKQVSEKTEIRSIKTETKPANFSGLDLAYNLCRFGYKEFGLQVSQGKKFCIEYITTAILLQEDARLMEAIPVILAKNSFKSNILAFLSQKFETSGKLMGLLKILHAIKPTRETSETIDFLETFEQEEIPADEESILQKMRLYNAM